MPVKLTHHQIASTRDPEKGEAILSREMSPLRFESVRHPNRFELTMNGVKLGKTMIGYNRFDTETQVNAGEVEDALIFTVSVGPAAVPSIDGRPIDPTHGTVTSPGKHLAIHRSERSEILILRTSIQSVEQHLRHSLGHPIVSPISFEPSVDLKSGVGVTVKRVLAKTIDQISEDPSILEFPLIQKSFDDLLLSALLSLPNSYSEEISTLDEKPFAPSLVRVAEEFMESHGTQAIGVSEVAIACGCSRRALFAAFRRHRQYTPMNFLADVRLRRARTMLLSPNPVDSVASIARQCGFMHAGRFSKTYCQQYGESPSQTLRRSKIER